MTSLEGEGAAAAAEACALLSRTANYVVDEANGLVAFGGATGPLKEELDSVNAARAEAESRGDGPRSRWPPRKPLRSITSDDEVYRVLAAVFASVRRRRRSRTFFWNCNDPSCERDLLTVVLPFGGGDHEMPQAAANNNNNNNTTHDVVSGRGGRGLPALAETAGDMEMMAEGASEHEEAEDEPSPLSSAFPSSSASSLPALGSASSDADAFLSGPDSAGAGANQAESDGGGTDAVRPMTAGSAGDIPMLSGDSFLAGPRGARLKGGGSSSAYGTTSSGSLGGESSPSTAHEDWLLVRTFTLAEYHVPASYERMCRRAARRQARATRAGESVSLQALVQICTFCAEATTVPVTASSPAAADAATTTPPSPSAAAAAEDEEEEAPLPKSSKAPLSATRSHGGSSAELLGVPEMGSAAIHQSSDTLTAGGAHKSGMLDISQMVSHIVCHQCTSELVSGGAATESLSDDESRADEAVHAARVEALRMAQDRKKRRHDAARAAAAQSSDSSEEELIVAHVSEGNGSSPPPTSNAAAAAGAAATPDPSIARRLSAQRPGGPTTGRSEEAAVDPADTPWASRQPVVLVVDDDRMQRMILRRHAARILGAKDVTVAEDGQDALEKYEALVAEGKHPDVVLTDLVMPRLDGIEFIRQFRNREATRADAPSNPAVIVAITGTTSRIGAKAVQAGADECIPKPLQPPVLAKILSTLVTSQRGGHAAGDDKDQ